MKNDDVVGNVTLNSNTFQVPGGITKWFDLYYNNKFAGKI